MSNNIMTTASVKELLTGQNMITCNSEHSVRSALKELVDKNILSMPVYTGKRLIGIVSLHDIISLIVKHDTHQDRFKRLVEDKVLPAVHPPASSLAMHLRDVAKKIVEEKRDEVSAESISSLMARLTIGELIEKQPMRYALHVIPENAMLQNAAEVMVREGAHRVAVVTVNSYYSGEYECVGILTQMRIAQFVHEHRAELFGSQRVKDTHFYKEVVSITDEEPVWSALSHIVSFGVSAVAVVESKSGKLIGQISEKDLREVGEGDLPTLHLITGGAFVKAKKAAGDNAQRERERNKEREKERERGHEGDVANIIVTPDTPVAEVSSKLVGQSHRVFVVDAQGFPIGVVSLRDLLQRCIDPNLQAKYKKISA